MTQAFADLPHLKHDGMTYPHREGDTWHWSIDDYGASEPHATSEDAYRTFERAQTEARAQRRALAYGTAIEAMLDYLRANDFTETDAIAQDHDGCAVRQFANPTGWTIGMCPAAGALGLDGRIVRPGAALSVYTGPLTPEVASRYVCG